MANTIDTNTEKQFLSREKLSLLALLAVHKWLRGTRM